MMETQQIAQAPSTITASPVPLEDVRIQMVAIQSLMRSVLKEDTHYGVIPGCGQKPALFKSGAEKIALMFRLSSKIIDLKMTEHPNNHREYRITVGIFTPDGSLVGNGVGVCSTLESKYRYRSELTGEEVPKEFWSTHNPELLGGPEFSTRKVKGKWLIAHRVEHTDPADNWNTVLKMAKKRGYVDGVISSTAASDLFTQDVEENRPPKDSDDRATKEEREWKQEQGRSEPKPADDPQAKDGMISKAQLEKIGAMERELTLSKKWCEQKLQCDFGVNSHKELTKRQGSEFITDLIELQKEQAGNDPETTNDLPGS